MHVSRTNGSALVLLAPVAVSTAPLPAAADSGFYIGGSAGGATIESGLNGVSIPGLPLGGIDEDDTALKVFAGYKSTCL